MKNFSSCASVVILIMTIVLSNANPAHASNRAVVDAGGQGDYTSVEAALAAGEHNIFIKNGLYEVSGEINVTQSNTRIRGESRDDVIIRQIHSGYDLLRVSADHVQISNITLDARTYDSQAAFVSGGQSYVTLRDSRILGSTHIFAIFFAGPQVSTGQETLDAVENNELDEQNRVINNIVEADWDGDVVSFSLQKRGVVSNNTVIGGRIVMYLTRDSRCTHNHIVDSISHGIFYNLPAYDNVIAHNTIERCLASGIKIGRQFEHPVGTEGRYGGLEVHHNTITDTRFFGIEMEQVGEARIHHNNIDTIDFHGIYMLRVDDCYVFENNITACGLSATRTPIWQWSNAWDAGVYAELDVINSHLNDNTIDNSQGALKYGMKIVNGCNNTGNLVDGNTFIGPFGLDAVDVNDAENIIGENTITE